MQFTVLALFAAAASLVVATPVPEIGTINAYPVVVGNIGVANPGLQVRSKANAPAPLRVGSDDAFQTNSCNAAERQCCQSLHQHSDSGVQSLLGALNLPIPAESGFMGVQCTPLASVLSGASTCNSEPVCCSGNHFDGMVSLGCNPVGGGGLLSGLGVGM